MKNSKIFILFFSLLYCSAFGQGKEKYSKEEKVMVDSAVSVSTQVFFKYSISAGPGLNVPANLARGNAFSNYSLGLLELLYGNRLIKSHKNIEFILFGIDYLPFQGPRIKTGVMCFLKNENHRYLPYFGALYSIGFGQISTNPDGNYTVRVGLNQNVIPCVGVKLKPWLHKIRKANVGQTPDPKSLIHFKFQLGYSNLINNVRVDTVGPAPINTIDIVNKNLKRSFSMTFNIGFDIPSMKYLRKHPEYNIPVPPKNGNQQQQY